VLQYLGRYTHRVAISNHRLVSFVDGQVTFLWRDSAHNNEQKPLTLSLDKFLRRFLLHILPQGFVRIRQSMISDPFCVLAPHAVTFDQQAVTKSIR
jgi:hypothetical protein